MPNIKKVELTAKSVQGLQIRTNNLDEMNPKDQKIAPLWGRFYEEILPKLSADAQVYGVYYNYASDAQGDFDVLVGADRLELTDEMQRVSLEEGQYLMFPVKGELPLAIVETWKKVWAYFEDESIDERRNYMTDFELYKSADEVEIYIGVNYF